MRSGFHENRPHSDQRTRGNARHASHHHFVLGFAKGHSVWKTIMRRRLKIVSFDKAI